MDDGVRGGARGGVRRWALTALTVATGCTLPTTTLRLPAQPSGPHAPSLLSLTPAAALQIGDTETCAGCHPVQAAAWDGSLHRHASLDLPWYRASLAALRDDVGPEALPHCAGCHDPVLLASEEGRATLAAVDAHGADAAQGVTCVMCHGVASATTDGNASLVVEDVPVPERVGVAAHRLAAQPPVDWTRVCGSCHRGFLGEATGNAWHTVGMDELGAWSGSAWSRDPALELAFAPEPKACIDCHDPHAAPGAHPGVADTHLLAGAVSVDLPSVRLDGVRTLPAGAATPEPGQRVELEVVLHNTGTGHRFPGGPADVSDAFVTVRVVDGRGRVVAASGDEVRRWPVRTEVVDASGRPVRDHRTTRIHQPAWSHSIGPGDAVVVRFAWQADDDVVLPWTVSAELRYRRFPDALRASACRARVPDVDVADPCAASPEVLVAGAWTRIGSGDPTVWWSDPVTGWLEAPPVADRTYALGLGLVHDVVERLDDARGVLAKAVEQAQGDAVAQARALWLQAVLEGRQGRVEDALGAVAAAEAFVGARPDLERARGDALARVWRWSEAAEAYARVAAVWDHDTQAWRDLARARGSAGQAREALDAALAGLRGAPRDPELLLSQANALRALGDPRAEAAQEAWLAHRLPDDRDDVVLRCEQENDGCRAARMPVGEVEIGR